MRLHDCAGLLQICCLLALQSVVLGASGSSSSNTTDNLPTSFDSSSTSSTQLSVTTSQTESSVAPSSTQASVVSAVSSRTSSSTIPSSTSILTSTSSSSLVTSASSVASTTSSSSSRSSSTKIDVSYETTFVVQGSSSVPTTISKTVVVIGTASGSSVAEVTAALNAASQENSGTGLSTQNKKIIIGVIAGIAGLVILSAFGTLLYRILGKRSSDDDYQEAKDLSVISSIHDTSAYSDSASFPPAKVRPKVGEISQNF